MKEGYIKFHVNWEKSAPPAPEELGDLCYWRDELKRLNLIGVYEDGIGFGNISRRSDAERFIISGSSTGHVETIQPEHFTAVTQVDTQNNTVWCSGPIVASSETMSHAVLYKELPEIRGVVHVHDAISWEQLLDKVPTTSPGATYGTPEMACSIARLIHHSDLPSRKIFVMRDHEEGIFTFGKNLEEAVNVLKKYLRR